MRAQAFLNWLYANYNPQQAAAIASNQELRGGWEVWLQVEIGMAYINAGITHSCAREVQYPQSLQRCDFFMHDTYGGGDDTYLELEMHQQPGRQSRSGCVDALQRRHRQDHEHPHSRTTTSRASPCWRCGGTVDPTNDNNQGGGMNGHPLNWYWSGNRRAYIWDTTGALAPPQSSHVMSLQTAQQNALTLMQQGGNQADRLLLYAVSII